MPTSGETKAAMRNEDIPSSADAAPASRRVRISASAWVVGIVRPIDDTRTKSAAAVGTSPVPPSAPVDISSRAVPARVAAASPTASTLSRSTLPTRTLPLICPTAMRPTALSPNSALNVCGEAP